MAAGPIAQAARDFFGWEHLRDGQEEAVAALVDGRDVITVLPTGAGKSAVYQLAGTIREGITVVVSPLIALQRDQLNQLEETPRAPKGVAINSSRGERAVEEAWDALAEGAAEFVFLAPEQLAKDDVVERLRRLDVGLLAVDEAHCVASWGHDFRPDYLRLGDVRERLGRPVTVALTATAAEPVRAEITARLGMRDALVVVRGVDRPNIDLTVHRATTDDEKCERVIDEVLALPKPGLVYTATRRDSEEYAEVLRSHGLRASAYHAGLPARERSDVHDAFLDDEVDVVVATNAFGMGIDKPNVRFVAHASVPDSLDAYYQEVGRAGRDGDPASAILFYRSEDLGLRKYFVARGVDQERAAAAYRALAQSDSPVKATELAKRLEISPRSATALLNLLAEAGAVSVTRRGARPRAGFTPAAAAAGAEEASERRERIEESRLEVMRRYAETRDCRRRVLLGYFGEDLPEPCGHCDTCRAGTAKEAEEEVDTPYPAGVSVKHIEWGRGSVVEVESDRITVFFEEQGYKVLALDAVTENHLLSLV
ncbi:RecQ family ATP-dependent DNA helicase [Microbacterium sp. 4R-513]|uniref:RecQ family ATP-dependent DNA helicase n=1 Tax=Microbacterium sp. 4R-513 TaxID=2567934 RepID=UPI0013E1E323|nr:ATP-dependent DNA helicase RecQ [Microbacterium sp. 4R-513]QIG40619.1 RecQ family ATP-dependent DNA helicase [Microbacterium sp. 4R-513]